jgi:membrane-associated HD superfamily phosphohydrolase
MKKLILILVSMLTLNIVFANSDTTTVNQPTETEVERVIDKYGEKIVNGFNGLVESVTPMAIDGFKIVVKLQIAKGFTMLLPLLFGIIFIILTIITYKRGVWCDGEPIDMVAILSIVLFCVSVIFTFIGFFELRDAIKYFIAPEWFAIKELVELFK